MQARDFRLAEADQIHHFFRTYRCHPPTGWWFRGQSNESWALLPKAGRVEYRLPGDRPLKRFNHWSKQAIAYNSDLPENVWERLAVAQHYGLATCYLDWTYNPLVAIYFACFENQESDGAVYCYDPEMFVNEDSLDPFNTECNGFGFIPRAISQRIVNQRSVFTVHLPPTNAIEVKPSPVLPDHPNLTKLVIPAALKQPLLALVDDYGVNSVTLFPDLEGLSRHLNWETQLMAKNLK